MILPLLFINPWCISSHVPLSRNTTRSQPFPPPPFELGECSTTPVLSRLAFAAMVELTLSCGRSCQWTTWQRPLSAQWSQTSTDGSLIHSRVLLSRTAWWLGINYVSVWVGGESCRGEMEGSARGTVPLLSPFPSCLIVWVRRGGDGMGYPFPLGWMVP